MGPTNVFNLVPSPVALGKEERDADLTVCKEFCDTVGVITEEVGGRKRRIGPNDERSSGEDFGL